MNYLIDWITDNWNDLLTIAAYIVAAASLIAKLTPSRFDDGILDAIRRFVDLLALNRSREKIAREN